MGQEIDNSRFNATDFEEFRHRLERETDLLGQWLLDGELRADYPVGGCELEAWLVDKDGHPAPVNQLFLSELNNPLVVPELSTFNVELNTHPRALGTGFMAAMQEDIDHLWHDCVRQARSHGAEMCMIGILPTVQQSDLCLANMSSQQRYRALNEQVFRLRKGQPIRLDIHGREHLELLHQDVMLEAAATSFQIHLKVDFKDAVRVFNASKIISAPMVAISANSPYLFGHDLWDETRVPLFEQAVSVGGSGYSKRVTFGIRYAKDSIMECFEANRDRYPLLLPRLLDEPEEMLPHLRLHNGTIWRWNRPLIGFSDDGRPHIRIEHRVVPSGPSSIDMVANAAFYFGAIHAILRQSEPIENRLDFASANRNFYKAARVGLAAEVDWLDGKTVQLRDLCLEVLCPLAVQGLIDLGCDKDEADYWIGIVLERVKGGLTGAGWQRRWIAANGRDFAGLVRAYHEGQESGLPVSRWV